MHRNILPLVKRLGRLGLAVSLLAAQTVAQQTTRAGEEKADETEAARELERKAVVLLEETMREAEGLKLGENRVRVQTVAAGLLWPRDEEAARAAFKRAADGIVAMIAEAEPSDPQYHNDRSTALQLRQQLVSTAAPYDARLALEFLRATRQPAPYVQPETEYKQPDPELNLETNLAAQVAAQDSKQALRMAEESLGRGVSQGLSSVFFQLAAKDKEGAARLATEIIKRLRPEELVRDYEMTNVAIQLLSQTRGDAAAAAQAASAAAQVIDPGETHIISTGAAESRVVIDENSRRRLVETLAAAAVIPETPNNSGITQNIVRSLGSALPEVERYAPARVAALKRRAARVEESNPRAQAWKQYNDVVQGATTVEAMIEAAPRVPAEMRNQLYTSAAHRALSEDNNLERARQLTEHVTPPEQRAQVLRDLERQHRMNAAQRGEYKDARRLVALTAGTDEKVQLLTQLAAAALNNGDKAAARELLEEARALVGRGDSAQQFYALFNVARAYAALDERATFEMTEVAVERLNELMAAAVVVNGFGQEAFKDGELRQQGGYIWNDLVGRCAQELAHLARKDFDRSRALAERFQRTDARVHAQLHLALSILQSAPSHTRGRPRPVLVEGGFIIRG